MLSEIVASSASAKFARSAATGMYMNIHEDCEHRTHLDHARTADLWRHR